MTFGELAKVIGVDYEAVTSVLRRKGFPVKRNPNIPIPDGYIELITKHYTDKYNSPPKYCRNKTEKMVENCKGCCHVVGVHNICAISVNPYREWEDKECWIRGLAVKHGKCGEYVDMRGAE